MLKPPIIAALCLALGSAAPAFAESPDGQDRGGSLPHVQLVDRQTAVGPPRSAEAGLFEGVGPGLGLSRQTLTQEDGSAAVRRGLIGSLPLSEGVSADVGLFTVTHDDQKEPEFRRNWSAKNIGPRNRTVAAVGLNVRF
jgi:hypothetical protein